MCIDVSQKIHIIRIQISDQSFRVSGGKYYINLNISMFSSFTLKNFRPNILRFSFANCKFLFQLALIKMVPSTPGSVPGSHTGQAAKGATQWHRTDGERNWNEYDISVVFWRLHNGIQTCLGHKQSIRVEWTRSVARCSWCDRAAGTDITRKSSWSVRDGRWTESSF
jgi:hypothetical protein